MTDDRRRLQRLNVHYDIQLSTPDREVMVTSVTDNLSGSGFFCTSDQPFAPGTRLSCELSIPMETIGVSTAKLTLHRRVKVMRVEVRGLQPGFGLACAFDDGSGTETTNRTQEVDEASPDVTDSPSGPNPVGKGQLKQVGRPQRS
jgi:hypothetical protein